MNQLEEKIGYRFSDNSLLARALTRKAYANEQRQRNAPCEDQEVFCTLGDAVLKTVLIDLLIKSGACTPDLVTQRKKELEREENLASLGKFIGIGASIRLGKGEVRQNAGEQPYVLAETMEAIIGAIFLDGGYCCAENRVREWFGTLIPR
ncbi:MAG TPA: ribonuclease III domain-containing protein [Methanoregulaceae archaeon]|nr:ribonuclease III domain-containing protein [Methanoregulaceae archaeon]